MVCYFSSELTRHYFIYLCLLFLGHRNSEISEGNSKARKTVYIFNTQRRNGLRLPVHKRGAYEYIQHTKPVF